MANRISSLAKREAPDPGQGERVVSTYSTDAYNRTPDNSFENDFRGGWVASTNWHGEQPSVVGGSVKRAFDISGALIAILLLFPLFCLIALAIKLWDRGPVLYRHRRVGLNGRVFVCLKFRTMVIDAEAVLSSHLAVNGEAAREWEEIRKLKRDPRITPFGLAMRKTSIDELPQLLNILRGDMSFVGPRPIVTDEVPKYGASIHHYFCARPGLTGAWQISGRNDVDYSTRVALDREYVQAWSLWRDLAIIAKTARVVVTSRGCY
jgi:exopolysaccharide production protein ExoY